IPCMSLPIPISMMMRCSPIGLLHLETDGNRRVGHHRGVARALGARDIQPAMMRSDADLAIGKDPGHRRAIHRFGGLHGDLHVDDHRRFVEAEQLGHVDRVAPQRILDGTGRGLGVVLPPERGAKAEFGQYAVLGHVQNSTPICALIPERNGCLTSSISVTRSAISISSSLALRPVRTTWVICGFSSARNCTTSLISR